ncbi:MAG: sensor histidine kinase [Acidobacteria bacterium]|nr:sensor histidine kinase [Acidobacteriota bacterium]MBV9070032.1 sensor histidine kinase [Acidobacteriota bacterium]MBV9186047.1 sensor histidine kinase [Acidobacteriota bacterium]
MKSFRTRLLIGSIIFAGGLLAVFHAASLAFFRRYPYSFVMRIDHAHILFVAVILIIIGVAQMRRGLSPFDELRARLAGVRDGRERRLEGRYPSEVQPLVNDLNALLDHRDEAVRRALGKAGDLAHGLKTPVAVLMHEADRTDAAGQHDVATEMRTQLDRMRRQLDYHLAHARAAASGAPLGARSSVAESANALARTLLRLHADRGLSMHVNVVTDHTVRVQREDLDEMLGNLLDNACKWAKSRVRITSSIDGANILITIDDDGAGLDPTMRDAVLQRGVRADEAAPGSGFGLAIVRDLADLYGGSIALEQSDAGGVRAVLRLPRNRVSQADSDRGMSL